MKKPKFSERSGSFESADIWRGNAGGSGAHESGANANFYKGDAGGNGAGGNGAGEGGAGGVGANGKGSNGSNMSGSSGGESLESAMARYAGMPQEKLMQEMMVQAARSRAAGELDDKALDNFYSSAAPLLNDVQRARLKELISGLKRGE